MKTAFCASLLLASASAFAPSQSAQRTFALSATAELEGMVGVSTETAGKIVSVIMWFVSVL